MMSTPTPQVHALVEAAAPRLMAYMQTLITKLRDRGLSVETYTVFLLDQTSLPFQVPHKIDGHSVDLNFAASHPAWSDRVGFHLYWYFHGTGTRRSVYERPYGLNLNRIAKRICDDLETRKRDAVRQARRANEAALSMERFACLAHALGVMPASEFSIRHKHYQVEGSPHRPNDVYVVLRTTHAGAEKIIKEFSLPHHGEPKP